MERTKLTEEQIKDIQEREKKALEYLKELQLTPAAIMQKINIGNDLFADKTIPYLQDIKYSGKETGVPSNDPEVNPNVV